MQREHGIFAPPHALEAAAELLACAPPQVSVNAMALLALVLNEVRYKAARFERRAALTLRLAAVASPSRAFTIVITATAAAPELQLLRHRHALFLDAAAWRTRIQLRRLHRVLMTSEARRAAYPLVRPTLDSTRSADGRLSL